MAVLQLAASLTLKPRLPRSPVRQLPRTPASVAPQWPATDCASQREAVGLAIAAAGARHVDSRLGDAAEIKTRYPTRDGSQKNQRTSTGNLKNSCGNP